MVHFDPPSFDTSLLDVLPTAVVLVDAGGRIAGWNRAAEVLYGHRRAEVAGRSVLEVLWDPADAPGAAARFERAAHGEGWEGDTRVRRRDGALLVSSFRLIPAGTAGGSVWVATDHIDQGLAEQERSVLLSAEHAARATAEEALGLLEAILASAPVAIAVFDRDLRYVRVNDAYAALSGLPAEAHTGGAFGDVVPAQGEVGADLRRVLETGRAVTGRVIEYRVGADVGPAGRSRHFSVSYFPVRGPGGALVGAGLSANEITQLKQVEQERTAALARAEEAQARLSVLATASSVLTSTMNLDELAGRIAGALTPRAADWCAIALHDTGGRPEHVAVSYRDRELARQLAEAARLWPRSGRGEIIEGGTIAGLLGAAPPVPDRPLGAGLVVPIDAGGEALGVLVLATDPGRHLGPADLELAAEIAHRASLAVGNARAFQHERQIAETLQRALLPATVPPVSGLQVAVRYLAATDGSSVGGDWYDVLRFDDDTTGIVIGDVVGHDIGASTSMGQLRSALRVIAHDGYQEPAATLARVDRVMGSLGLSYATCIFGVVDGNAGRFRWSNAGHPPPVLVHGGRATVLTGGSGVILGVTAGADTTEASVDLHHGDLLVLYTDGLVERRGESVQEGVDRLATVAEELAGCDAEAFCEGALAKLLPASAREDDVAIVVVRVCAERRNDGAHRLAFDPEPQSVARARHFVAGLLRDGGWGAQADVAMLLVSELVTNALRHGGGQGALTVRFGPDTVEVSVEDGEEGTPAPRQPEPFEEGGRGLHLVDALAAAWGVRPRPGAAPGKATWFTLGAP